MRKFKIGKSRIGQGEKVYFVADIAANHDEVYREQKN